MTGADAPESDGLEECRKSTHKQGCKDRPWNVTFRLAGDSKYDYRADYDTAQINQSGLDTCSNCDRGWWNFVGLVTDVASQILHTK